MRLKAEPGGWFAAEEGFERALRVLSDPTFKVFAYVCLRAERASGRLEFDSSDLAQELGKSRASLGRCLRELVGKGICELEAARSHHRVRACGCARSTGLTNSRRTSGQGP